MFCYRDRTYCPNRECKKTNCPFFFNEKEYAEVSEKIGFEMPVSWFTEQPECPKIERQLSTVALARRTAKRRREKELLRQMKGGAR